MEVFGLKHIKEECYLEIAPFHDNRSIDGVVYWNDTWFLSNDRKLLRKKALEMKKEWILETKLRLELLENLSIKHKYK